MSNYIRGSYNRMCEKKTSKSNELMKQIFNFMTNQMEVIFIQ